ncbi:MAG TPA: hypothetical protein DD670_15860 [Planctomycetaceae bacterium]|nr:hypothetical protein [Planctomycetaceae bacterium]
MDDLNPYQPPDEYNEPFAPKSDDSWPKTAVATIDADWYARAFRVHQRREMLSIRVFVIFIAVIVVLAGLAHLLGGDPAPNALAGRMPVIVGLVVVGVLSLLIATRGAHQRPEGRVSRDLHLKPEKPLTLLMRPLKLESMCLGQSSSGRSREP